MTALTQSERELPSPIVDRQWWKESVVYQIYPRSFMDSNGDGIGDIQGIISKLDYLQQLGVDVVWLSPVYASPNDDNGYDISDYQAIMDEFGTLDDWKMLLSGLKSRGMKLIMDLVVNHTSDEHHWFVESRKSADNQYRDYYIWRSGIDGQEPNNWISLFSGSAWKLDEATGQYYLHLFSQKQPDLNWDNELVRANIYKMMMWWLDLGIDGFRMDVINLISKDQALPSSPSSDRYAWGGQYFMNGPRVHEFLQEMNREVLSKYDCMTVGETPGADIEEACRYAACDGSELNMIFQFEHMGLDSWGDKWDVKPWNLHDLKAVMTKWQKGLEGRAWNSLYLNNHDQPRMVSRFGNDGEYRMQSAKMLATFLHGQQGTPYIYQGEEIGMTNVRFADLNDYKDIETHNMYRIRVLERGYRHEDVMESIYLKGRDNARTPMQWDDSPHGGFTSGTPWLGVNPNFKDINAEAALRDTDSIFHHYKQLITLRKKHEVMVYGRYDMIADGHDQIYAYTRTLGDEKWIVVCNFFGGEPEFRWNDYGIDKVHLILSNYKSLDNGIGVEGCDESVSSIRLRPYEANIYQVVG
ncbi:alpha-glucosidase [Paenibacillus sp. N1-5-1-14]|uniref:glycoside hydrolase family 13 protein n=1 Tax=Paenibacillus radicibacter TaxID=2972488 RepID=UPI002158A4E9|nr:alpha-glucosidase [Paenibacillus radicibacter]MCR8641671.1 alpha-glucosidase [Paenibacillus radicibacter]